MENYLHPDAIQDALQVTVSFGEHDDVPAIVAKAVHEADPTSSPWDELGDDRKREKEKRVKRRPNDTAASRMTCAQLREMDTNGDVEQWLRQIAGRLS